MASNETTSIPETASRMIDSVRDAEESALEAVRKFVDTVNGIFPDRGEDGPRRQIIDSAFKMTQQLVGASADLAQKVVKTTSDALTQVADKAGSSTS
jgi:hypothetical protein